MRKASEKKQVLIRTKNRDRIVERTEGESAFEEERPIEVKERD